MRHLPLLATGLLATALLSATAPSYAAGETCRGQAATLVGTPGQVGLTGTEGPDVIVTNGAASVSALGGNDLVCITGGASPAIDTRLDAGAGDDVVDAAAATNGVRVQLGTGSDTYTGSPFRESVYAGIELPSSALPVDTERDSVTTGAGGDDTVFAGSDRTVPNSDVVVLGSVGRVFWAGPMATGGRLDGNAFSSLTFTVGSGAVVVDAATGTMTEDGAATLTWSGFDEFYTGGTGSPTPASYTFRGTDRSEIVGIRFDKANDHRQSIDMGGGGDTLLLGYDDNIGARGSTYAGGTGRDFVATWAGKSLDLDLRSGRMVTRHDGRTVRNRLTGFESQLVGARKLVLKGTAKADELRFYACQATVRGRGGKDDIRQSKGDDYFEGGLRCKPQQRARLFGDGGNDTLRGTLGDDLLIGGRGRDTIEGNGGRDTCSGEKLKSCEIKRR